MKVTVANAIREQYIQELFTHYADKGEDVGMITSNSFNFPIVFDGEECAIEVVVKVPKYDGDEIYALRDDYQAKCEEKTAKAEAAARKKAEKIARDERAREEKRAAREAARSQ